MMNNQIMTIWVSFLLTLSLSAQEIGLRFGEMHGNNIAIDATIPIKDTRIHTFVSFGDDVGLDVLYDFAVKPIFRSPDLKYYVGLGLSTLFAGDFILGVAGEAGIEYAFPRTPLSIGIDYRPSVVLVEEMDFAYANFGFNLRYIFR